MRKLLIITSLAFAGCGSRGKSDSQAAKSEPAVVISDDWTHKDLADFLGKKGIKVEITSYRQTQGFDAKASVFFDGNADVVVYQFKSPQIAVEQAKHLVGKDTFTKGRFGFGLDPKLFESQTNKAKLSLDQQLLSRIKVVLSDL